MITFVIDINPSIPTPFGRSLMPKGGQNVPPLEVIFLKDLKALELNFQYTQFSTLQLRKIATKNIAFP